MAHACLTVLTCKLGILMHHFPEVKNILRSLQLSEHLGLKKDPLSLSDCVSVCRRSVCFLGMFSITLSGPLSFQDSSITLRYIFFRTLEDAWCDNSRGRKIHACEPDVVWFEHLQQDCIGCVGASHLQRARPYLPVMQGFKVTTGYYLAGNDHRTIHYCY